jgi:hypothetical protein
VLSHVLHLSVLHCSWFVRTYPSRRGLLQVVPGIPLRTQQCYCDALFLGNPLRRGQFLGCSQFLGSSQLLAYGQRVLCSCKFFGSS